MYSRLDLIRDFMLGLMVVITVDTLVKLGFHNIVAYVASLSPTFVLVIIALNLLVLDAIYILSLLRRAFTIAKRARAPGVSQDRFEPSTSLVVHEGPRQRSTDLIVSLALQLAARVQLFAVSLDVVYLLPLRRTFTIVKRARAPGVSQDRFEPSTSLVVHEGLRQRSTDLTVALALRWAARVQFVAMSCPMVSALLADVDDSESASSSAAVYSIPGEFVGEAPVVGLLYFPLLAFCCSVFVSFDAVADSMPLLVWVCQQVQDICAMWRIVSGPEYSSVLLPAYNNIPIVHTTPVSAALQPNNTEAQTDETGAVDAADSDSENDEADITLVEENQRLLTYSKSNLGLPTTQSEPIFASHTGLHSMLPTCLSSPAQLGALPSFASIADTEVDAVIEPEGDQDDESENIEEVDQEAEATFISASQSALIVSHTTRAQSTLESSASYPIRLRAAPSFPSLEYISTDIEIEETAPDFILTADVDDSLVESSPASSCLATVESAVFAAETDLNDGTFKQTDMETSDPSPSALNASVTPFLPPGPPANPPAPVAAPALASAPAPAPAIAPSFAPAPGLNASVPPFVSSPASINAPAPVPASALAPASAPTPSLNASVSCFVRSPVLINPPAPVPASTPAPAPVPTPGLNASVAPFVSSLPPAPARTPAPAPVPGLNVFVPAFVPSVALAPPVLRSLNATSTEFIPEIMPATTTIGKGASSVSAPVVGPEIILHGAPPLHWAPGRSKVIFVPAPPRTPGPVPFRTRVTSRNWAPGRSNTLPAPIPIVAPPSAPMRP
ncbi:hypothetical protein DFH08DRAFT_802801 [Mycena albidolilacea]|uniref:Uncharacterized protein n=1 Tax=Mycena albidolilacea TaxID=1033008 RepID=A0AAD7EZ19_9AGAR|nr:hypothetical protein DFH08DRAFT_802801 [Mycena albidolilacea]